MDGYPATYSDFRGTESTVLTNDGDLLRLTVRGVELSGPAFDSLYPPPDATPEQLGQFTLCQGSLCACRIECRMPVPVEENGRIVEGFLNVDLTLGNPTANGGTDRDELRIALEYAGRRIAGTGTSGWFEDELLDIQKQLPAGVHMKACINCLYSDYSPAGHGSFGGMMCFRNLKADYLKVKSKAEFWPVLHRCDRIVQETYLCPEFERRVPGTGYRG